MQDCILLPNVTCAHLDVPALIEKIKALTAAFAQCGGFQEELEVFREVEQVYRTFDTAYSLVSIYNTIDTTDEQYRRELAYLDEKKPAFRIAMRDFQMALLASPELERFKEIYGSHYFDRLQAEIRLADERISEDLVKEAELTNTYFRVVATATTEYGGEQVGISTLAREMLSDDRGVRAAAFHAWAALYASIADELDELYAGLVKLRIGMAKKLGFESYVEMAYLQLGKSYTKKEVAKFREQVRKYVVPVCRQIFAAQQEKLGVGHLEYYDESITDRRGNPTPIGTTEELVEKARAMYRELSPETGEFFDYLCRYRLFDLEAKPGKQQGGYCTVLAEHKAPFIFSNFNRTSADVVVLTHEAGHAFSAYLVMREDNVLTEQIYATADTSEIQSMSMEFFTYPWMESFFGADGERYRSDHNLDSLKVLPYMVSVDEFQERVFEEELTDPKAWRRVWKELEEKYLPWRSYDGDLFLEEGGFWMQKQHIFGMPFYYVDYAMAQFGAYEFYLHSLEDRKDAWEHYVALGKAGGRFAYRDLLKLAGLRCPLDEGVVEDIMQKLCGLFHI